MALIEAKGVDEFWKPPVQMPHDLGTSRRSLATVLSLAAPSGSGVTKSLPPQQLFPPVSSLDVFSDELFRVPPQHSREDVVDPGEHGLNKEIEYRHGELWSRAYKHKKRQ